MEQKKYNIVIIIIATLIAMILISITTVFVYSKIKENQLSETNEDQVSETNKEQLSETNEIENLLNSNLIFQNSKGVGSRLNGLYKFNIDGTFVFSDKEVVKTNYQILYMEGLWEYSESKLKLTVQEQYEAISGVLVHDVILGDILENYTIKKSNEEYTKEYKIKYDNEVRCIDGDLILYPVSLSEKEKQFYFGKTQLEK